MSLFKPDHCFESVLHITPEFLHKHGVRGLAIDLDNTLAPYKHRKIKPAVAAWLAGLRERGIRFAVLSNANERRVADFCAPLGLPYISKAGKPGGKAYKLVSRLLRLEPRQIGMVGDQIFTDIQGAKRHGLFAIWVKPICLSNPFYRLRSWLETPFIRRAPHGETGL